MMEWGSPIRLHYRRQRSCCKIIFSVVVVCQSFCPQEGAPYDHYRLCLGPHCRDPTTGSGPLVPVLLQTWDRGTPPNPDPLLVTSGGQHWRPVQTGSLDLTVQPLSPRVLTSGSHPTGMLSCCIWGCSLKGASWWNHWVWRVVLFSIFFSIFFISYINRYLCWKILRAQGKHSKFTFH